MKLIIQNSEYLLSEIVDNLFKDSYPDYWEISWEDVKEAFTEALNERFPNLSKTDLDIILTTAQHRYNVEMADEIDAFRQNIYKSSIVESKQLKDRQSIIYWISKAISSLKQTEEEFGYGDIGFGLTASDITDLIIKNGNKI